MKLNTKKTKIREKVCGTVTGGNPKIIEVVHTAPAAKLTTPQRRPKSHTAQRKLDEQQLVFDR